MRVVLETTHLSHIGGAENYLMRLAMALDDRSSFYIEANWPSDFNRYNGFGRKFEPYSGMWEPDVYIHCSHFSRSAPIGHRNYEVCLFPKVALKPEGYDGVISICDYTASYVQQLWGMESVVIEPCVDPSLYSIAPKEKKIVSIGHFFEEEDGHSKNQHILAEAFTLTGEGYELVLIGNSNRGDENYLRKVRKASNGKRIRIEANADQSFVKKELSTASHLWHANGFQRSDPAQTEHFGIIALEAIASGVVPIVHKSGGCASIDGVNTWEQPEDLGRLTRLVQGIPSLSPRYTVGHFNQGVGRWLSSISI